MDNCEVCKIGRPRPPLWEKVSGDNSSEAASIWVIENYLRSAMFLLETDLKGIHLWQSISAINPILAEVSSCEENFSWPKLLTLFLLLNMAILQELVKNEMYSNIVAVKKKDVETKFLVEHWATKTVVYIIKDRRKHSETSLAYLSPDGTLLRPFYCS